jgi:hypothetical protein
LCPFTLVACSVQAQGQGCTLQIPVTQI